MQIFESNYSASKLWLKSFVERQIATCRRMNHEGKTKPSDSSTLTLIGMREGTFHPFVLFGSHQSDYFDTLQGGFHLLALIIRELKSHMTCYNSMPLIG